MYKRQLRAQALPIPPPAEEAVGGVGAALAEGGAGTHRPGRRLRRVLRGVQLVGTIVEQCLSIKNGDALFGAALT